MHFLVLQVFSWLYSRPLLWLSVLVDSLYLLSCLVKVCVHSLICDIDRCWFIMIPELG